MLRLSLFTSAALICLTGCGSREITPNANKTSVSAAPAKATAAAPAKAKEPELTVIFQHSPSKSIGKLVREDAKIPPGWEGGAGRRLSATYAQREAHIAAILSNGKEGETATEGR